jgi:hypothetical protein
MADFRKETAQALKGVCRAWTVLCKAWELFGRDLSARDGSPGNAVKSKARPVTEQKLQHLLKQINEQIDASLQALDAQDTLEARTTTPPQDAKQNSRHAGHSKAKTPSGLRRSSRVKKPSEL